MTGCQNRPTKLATFRKGRRRQTKYRNTTHYNTIVND